MMVAYVFLEQAPASMVRHLQAQQNSNRLYNMLNTYKSCQILTQNICNNTLSKYIIMFCGIWKIHTRIEHVSTSGH